MLRRFFLLVLVVPALMVIAGCQFTNFDEATSNTDRIILGGGGAAVEINHNGQSAMLGGPCARRMGTTLQKMKDEGKTMADLRSELVRSCSVTSQQSTGQLAQPVRGRLFAPLRSGSGDGARSGYSDYYYYWFFRPLNYWSTRQQNNVSWCQNFFYGWRGGDCFNLFYDFNNYSYYNAYCRNNCFASIYTTSTGTTTSTSSTFRYDPCVANGCYGQWYGNRRY